MIKKIALASVLTLTITSANAQFLAGRSIDGVGCDANNICFINVVGSPFTSCTNALQVRWDGGTPQGKAWLATALTAKASGQAVTVGTLDICSGDFDTVNFITLK